MFERTGKHFGEPLLIVFWHLGHSHVIQVDLVLLMEIAALDSEFEEGRPLFLRSDDQYIEVGRLSRKAVYHRNYKTAHAIHARLFCCPMVEFPQKGAPRFGDLLNASAQEDSPPSCLS